MGLKIIPLLSNKCEHHSILLRPHSVNSQNQKIDCNPRPAGRMWFAEVMSATREKILRYLTFSRHQFEGQLHLVTWRVSQAYTNFV